MSPTSQQKQQQPYKPVPTTNNAGSTPTMITKRKHIQFTSRDDDKDIHPGFCLGPLPRRIPILLTTEHTFFCPWGTKKGQFLIRNADICGRGTLAMNATIVILVSFSDNGMREIGGEAQC